MARSVRLVSAPPATGHSAMGSWRQLKDSMGAVVPESGMAPLGEDAGPPDRFESSPAVDESAWTREVAQRESALGLPAPAPRQTKTEVIYANQPMAAPELNVVNISGLPDDFTLRVQQKSDGWWVVTAPEQHVGLFVAHQDLLTALSDAPGALAQILRLDGPVPAKKRRNRGQ